MKILLCSKYKDHQKWQGTKETLETKGYVCVTPLDIDLKLFGKSGLTINNE